MVGMGWFFIGFFTVIVLAYINHFISMYVTNTIDLNYGSLLEFYPNKISELNRIDPPLYRWKKLINIIRHKIAYLYVQFKYDHNITWRAICHDCDKMLLIIFCWNLSTTYISTYHRIRSRHHIKANTEKDRYYQIIDYECARYTKKDKPYSAYEWVTLKHDNKEIDDEIYNVYLSIINRLNLNK